MTNHEKAEAIRHGVQAYLRNKYGYGDKTWHPLFLAAQELYLYLLRPSQ
jgi:hypothetical protein